MSELLLGLTILLFIFMFCVEREFRNFVISMAVVALILTVAYYLGDFILN